MHITSRRILILIPFVAVMLYACGTPRPQTHAPCITSSMHGLMIRWGTEDEQGRVEAYEMNSLGEIFDVSGPNGQQITPTYLRFLDGTVYCERAASIKDAFLQTQAMNVRGPKARFVEYVNPASNVYLRVVWNPDLSTFQSRYFRAEYEALMQHVPAP